MYPNSNSQQWLPHSAVSNQSVNCLPTGDWHITDSQLTMLGKVCMPAKWPIRPELIPVSIAWDKLGVFLLLHGRDVSLSQGYPPALSSLYPFLHLGREWHHESKVSRPRTQHNVPSRAQTQTARCRVDCTDHKATSPYQILKFSSKFSTYFLYPYLYTK